MALRTPKGIRVPFPERLSEGYQVSARESGGYYIALNVDGDRLEEVFRALVELVPDPGFLILESPCNQVKEEELRKSDSDPFHRDVYYMDGLERWQFFEVFDEYADILIHDGFIHFGFGEHNNKQMDEVFVGAYKIVSIYTHDTAPYEALLGDFDIPRVDKLVTAWDTFSSEHPGFRDKWGRGEVDIYFMIEQLMRERQLYLAKVIED